MSLPMGPNYLNIIYCILITLIDSTFAHYYCEFGFCETDQYCCGANKCCNKVEDLWYFWVGIVLVIIFVLLIICIKYYQYRKKLKLPNYRYSSLLNVSEEP